MFRTIAGVLALTLGFPLAAAAQSAPAAPVAPAPQSAPGQPGAAAPHHHHHNRYMAALRTLTLSDDQKTQIRGFVRDTKAANADADAPTRHANAKKLRDEIGGVLTPDQQAQLRSAMAQERTAAPAQQ